MVYPMEVALLGGIGFIGVNVAEEMIKRGWKVIVVSRRSSTKKRPLIYNYLRGLKVSFVFVDRIDYKSIKDLSPDVFVYLIGKISGSKKDLWESHVEILKDMIKVAESSGSKIIYMSAISSLGDIKGRKEGDMICEEDKHLDPNMHFQRNDFERSKAEGERLLVDSSMMLRGRWTIIRPGLVAGRWAYHIEWRSISILARLGLKLSLYPVPITCVEDLSRLVVEASEGRYDSLWINAISKNADLEEISEVTCRSLALFKKCININVKTLIKISPGIGPLKVIKDLVSRSYIYRSKYLKNFDLKSLEECIKDYAKWLKRYVCKF